MKFVLSQQTEKSLQEIWDYYFQRGGTRLADRIVASIRDAIDRLIDRPGLGHFRPDLTNRSLRFYRVGSVLLIYNPISQPLHIVRVYHRSQDIRSRMLNEPD